MMGIAMRETTKESVYSNFDHKLDEEVVAELRSNPSRWGQHAAFDFCGWVRYSPQGSIWVEEVWVHGSKVQEYRGDDLARLIADVNAEYGTS